MLKFLLTDWQTVITIGYPPSGGDTSTTNDHCEHITYEIYWNLIPKVRQCLGDGCVQDNHGCCYRVFKIYLYNAVPVNKMLWRKFGFGGFRRGSRGGVGVGSGTPPPLEFSKYISRRTIFNISRFSALSTFLYAHFKMFGPLRSPVIISN